MDFEEGGTGPLSPSSWRKDRCEIAWGESGAAGMDGCGACKTNGLLFDLCYHRTLKARWLQTGWNRKKKNPAQLYFRV